MTRYNDVREPIEYVVEQYFQRQKTLRTNMEISLENNLIDPIYAVSPDWDLPDHPITLIRGEDGKLKKIIYGEVDLLDSDEESSPIVWQEELVRGIDSKLEKVITTYPDGEELESVLIRDTKGKLERYE